MPLLTQIFTRRRIIAVISVLLFLYIALYLLTPRIQIAARNRTVAVLAARFESDVQISDFHLSLFPSIHVSIHGLVLRHKGRTDIPPLVEAREIYARTNIFSILLPRPRITLVRIYGLRIHVPARHAGSKPMFSATDQDLAKKYPVLIEEIRADDALLATLRAQPEKPPREFPVHHLELQDVSFDRPAAFHALLAIPVPKGEIDSTGEFGPWQADEPSLTPVAAKYTLENADMGTLKGLQGTLTSKGKFSGPLDYLNVSGETDMPDFSLRATNQPVALHTDFTAFVNGTNGDTILKSVSARFLHTSLAVSGDVIDVRHEVKGRSIELDAASTDARVEDLLRLAVKSSEPLVTGSARLRSKIEIPEGDSSLLDRLKMEGQFGVGEAQFTSPGVQGKIDTLSRKGQGQPKNADIGNVVSQLNGNFRVSGGVVTFTDLSFVVAGAHLQLNGTYAIDSGEMDFHGELALQAKLSQTTTGAKSFFLKAVDPFFKGKNAGTVLPIRISGTKDNPSIGLDRGADTKKSPAAAPVKSK
jgi:AsmA-like protein